MDYGPMPDSDTKFKRRARLLQAWYRVEVLKESRCGIWRPGSDTVGSSLVDGDSTGANFLSPCAFDYARQRLEVCKATPEMTIEEHRLFNNMLSSMPMCFNIFSDIRHALAVRFPDGRRVLEAIFDCGSIDEVSLMEVEYIPLPIHEYTSDQSSFDAVIQCVLVGGGKRLFTIETKYTDSLGGNKASKKGQKPQLAAEVFTEAATRRYAEVGYDQVVRNLLLTHAFAKKHGIEVATNYVVGLADDSKAIKQVESIRDSLLPEWRHLIEWLSLETIVIRGLKVAGPFMSDHLKRFHRRYLDFGQIQHLL